VKVVDDLKLINILDEKKIYIFYFLQRILSSGEASSSLRRTSFSNNIFLDFSYFLPGKSFLIFAFLHQQTQWNPTPVRIRNSKVADPHPDSTGSVDPDPGGQKWPTKVEKKFMF
jgi:hypothetical protein